MITSDDVASFFGVPRTVLADVVSIYSKSARLSETVVFACLHEVIFPDDVDLLLVSSAVGKPEVAQFWSANGQANDARLVGCRPGGGVRACPKCPGKFGKHKRMISRTVRRHFEGQRRSEVTIIEVIYDFDLLQDVVNRVASEALPITESIQ